MRDTLVAVPCLDDNAVNAYVARTLPQTELQRVTEHLSSCDDCLTITCAAARANVDGEPATTPATAAATTSDNQVDRYTLVEMIGRGAMGTVYIAHDPRLDRRVALKLVRPRRFADPTVRARLTREARAMAQVRHANVVTVYDTGPLADGVYIAMELVDGDTLARWLVARERRWQDIVRVFVAAGRGLVAAHAAGIVHRDFKPDNVLVDRDDRPAVTDFGLAAAPADASELERELADLSLAITDELTRTGALLGTPRYMSPEQFRGEAVDHSTDQFSFAIALFEALYRVEPFAGATIGERARAVAAGELRARPADAAAPRRIHHVLARALAAQRAARFPSVAAMLDALEHAARPRWHVPALAAAGAAVIAAAIALWPARPRPPTPVGDARVPLFVGRFANRTGDARLDDTLDVAVAAVLSSSTQIDPVAGVELRAVADGVHADAADVDAIAAKLATTDPRPTMTVHGSIDAEPGGGGFVIALDLRDRGATATRFAATRRAASLDDVVAASAQLAGELLVALGEPPAAPTATRVLSSSVAAIHAWMDGQRHAIADDSRGALAPYRSALAIDPDFAVARSALGLTLYNLADKTAAIAELERALRDADRMPERQRLTLMGDYYGTVGRYSESIMAYQQLLAKWTGDARTQLNLTATAIDASSWPLALESARAAARSHPTFEVVRRNLVLAELGNELLADAARDGEALVAEVGRPSGTAVASLAASQELLGRRGEAAATVARLDAIDPDLAPHARADLAAYEGRLDDAEAALSGRAGAVDQLVLALVRLRRGDRAGALAAATAAMADDSMPLAYLAASVAVDAGGATGLADKARAWGDMPETDRRMFGKLLEGDLARADRRPSDAIAAYRAAGRIGASWLVHDRLARAELAAHAELDAEHELAWCLAHRGQAAVVANPSLALLPELYLALARSKDARGAPPAEVRAAYQAVVDLAPAAQRDPWTEEARRRLAALPP